MRFNQHSVSTAKKLKTTNYEGGLAFKHKDPESELYARVATCLVKEPKFYGDSNEEFNVIINLVEQILNEQKDLGPSFVLKLAVYARNILHLRSIPVALLCLQALHPNRRWVRNAVPHIVKRADELAEVISFIEAAIGKIGDEEKGTMLPMSLKKGLQDVFPSFTEYQFSKYDRNNSETTMQDVIRLVHPKPETEYQKLLYRKIAKGQLESADTWEVLISGKGSTTEAWNQAVPKMPIMATIRNLRNLLDNNVSQEAIQSVINKLEDEKTILNSKQFPFRFLAAYRMIENNHNPNTSRIMSALDTAMAISVRNIPRLEGRTAIFCDNSSSMNGAVSDKSKMQLRDIGSMFGAIASMISPSSIIGAFADRFAIINFSAANTSLLSRAKGIDNINVGGSTFAHLAFDYLVHYNIKVDRIFLFSDMQCYNTINSYFGNNIHSNNIHNSWNQYKHINPNCYLYSFDLAGYGSTQVPETDPRVLTIAGWSESILKYVPYFEQDKKTVLEEIRRIEI